jgi:hypothetical protein
MIKRQFYAIEHADNGDDASSSSSSSSSSSLNTSSDLSSAAEDEEDDGAWPASSHESDESLREEGEEAGSGAQLAPLHALLVPYLQFFFGILTEHDHL